MHSSPRGSPGFQRLSGAGLAAGGRYLGTAQLSLHGWNFTWGSSHTRNTQSKPQRRQGSPVPTPANKWVFLPIIIIYSLLTIGIVNNNNNKAKPTKPAPSSCHWRLLTHPGCLAGVGAVLGAGVREKQRTGPLCPQEVGRLEGKYWKDSQGNQEPRCALLAAAHTPSVSAALGTARS